MSLTAGQLAAASQDRLVSVYLVALHFDGDTEYVTNAPGDVVEFGNTFRSVGELGAISTLSQVGDGRASNFSLSLSLPNELPDVGGLADAALGESIRGRLVEVWLRIYTPQGIPLADDPIPLEAGEMDTLEIRQDVNISELVLICETAVGDLVRANGSRYTDADQRRLFANDRGLEYVAKMEGQAIELGDGSQLSSGGGPAGSGGIAPAEPPPALH